MAAKKATPSVYRSGPMVGKSFWLAVSVGCRKTFLKISSLSYYWAEQYKSVSLPINIQTRLPKGKRTNSETEEPVRSKSKERDSSRTSSFIYDLQHPPTTASWHLTFQKPAESHVQHLVSPPATRSEPNQAGKQDKSKYKIGTNVHVARLRSPGLIEAQCLLVPGQGSTCTSGVSLRRMVSCGEESSVVVMGSAKRRPKWQSLDRLHLLSAHSR